MIERAARRAGVRRRRRIGLATATGLLLTSALLPGCHGGSPPPRRLTFAPSGLDGGGFVNVVAYDPSGSGVVLAGGDVSGIQRSTDFGRTWAPANTGVEGLAELKVASLLFSPRVAGEVYAAVGDEGRVGGLLVSTDDGRSWSLRSDVPRFSGGNNPGTLLPSRHPRSTGTLLAADPTRDVLYAATFDAGIMRSNDDGRTWTTLGLAGSYLRGLALDPAHPEVLYVAAFDDAVYRTTAAGSTGTFARLAGSPRDAEELAIVATVLYAAAGRQGLLASSDGGATWRPLLGSDRARGPVWEAIAGYDACGHSVLYAGADDGGANSIVRSADGGSTWISLAAGRSGVRVEEGGPRGPRWWLASQPEFLLGGSLYTASQIAVDTRAPPSGGCLRPRLLVAGRSGVWGSADSGSSWYPMVRGLAVTIVHAVAVDPDSPGNVFAAAADWGLLSSTNGGVSVTAHPIGGSGFGLTLDAGVRPRTLYVGVGSPDVNEGGEVVAGSDPAGRRWIGTGLAAAAGGRVLAVSERRISDRPVVLAAVDGEGVWRRSGSGTWSEVNPGALPAPEAAGGVSFAWATASTVYLYDRQTGLWRSGDAGASWTKIWAIRSLPPFTGWIAADPSAPSRLFVSVGDDGLYRLDGADSGTVEGGRIGPRRVGSFAHPGPVAVGSDGVVYAAELAVGGPPDLRVSQDSGEQWRSVADATYRASGVFPLGLTPSQNGELFVAMNGGGLLIGHPAE